jgi:hypothetical protein
MSVLLSLAGAVLVVVCLNISGMMLVRGAGRERELSIRAALGADRRRLVQHLFLKRCCWRSSAARSAPLCCLGFPRRLAGTIGAPVPQEIDSI